MKLITFAVNCHDCEANIRRCVESLLPAGEDIEIILIDDGSTDGTAAIADQYAHDYPELIRVVHQENGGAGSVINSGINFATGLYFKTVNANDWLEETGLVEMVTTLSNLVAAGCMVDMMILNVVYEKSNAKRRKVSRYRSALPTHQLFEWSDTGSFKKGHFMIMDSLVYRTQLLRDCHMVLPKNVFCADKLFSYIPLPYVSVMYYLDIDVYRSCADVEDDNFKGEPGDLIDQQIIANEMMIDMYDLWKMPYRSLRHYMFDYLEHFTAKTTMSIARGGGKENSERRKELWGYLKETDPKLYRKMSKNILPSAWIFGRR